MQSAGLLTRAVTWAHTSPPLPGPGPAHCSVFSPELVTREQTEECGARWQGGGVKVSRFNLPVWCQCQVSQVHTRPLPLTSMKYDDGLTLPDLRKQLLTPAHPA